MTPSSMFSPNWNMLVLSCGRYNFPLCFFVNHFCISFVHWWSKSFDIRWNQAPCLTMSWSPTIQNTPSRSPKKHGARTRRYIINFLAVAFLSLSLIYLVLIEFHVSFKVEKAAFEEAEKKREEEVTYLFQTVQPVLNWHFWMPILTVGFVHSSGSQEWSSWLRCK